MYLLISINFQEYFIKSIGGCEPKDHIKRSLVKLFTNEYSTNCTWTGRGKEISTKIGDSELMRILKCKIIIYNKLLYI